MSTDDRRPDDGIDDLLGVLDHPVPRVSAASVIARARRRGARRHPALAWAAGIALALGLAGVAWAAPGSPLRDWLAALVARSAPPGSEQPVVAPAATQPRAGVAISADRPVLLHFRTTPAGSMARVVLTDGGEVTVRAPVGSTAFTADTAGLGIDVKSAVTIDIAVPRGARRVQLVTDRRLFLKDGETILSIVSPDSTGAYVLPLRD